MILSLFAGAISPYYFAIIAWSILIVVSLIVEFVTDELTIIWGTVGAVCTLIATIFHAPIWLQFVIFFITTGLFVLLTRPLIKKHNKKIPHKRYFILNKQILVFLHLYRLHRSLLYN